jgi:hypothetical protein
MPIRYDIASMVPQAEAGFDPVNALAQMQQLQYQRAQMNALAQRGIYQDMQAQMAAQREGRQAEVAAQDVRNKKLEELKGLFAFSVNSQADLDKFTRYAADAGFPNLAESWGGVKFTPEWKMSILKPEEAGKTELREIRQPDGSTTTVRVPVYGTAPATPIAETQSAAELEPVEDTSKNIIGYRVKGTGTVISPEEAQDRYTMGREGTGKNPRSSAQGIGQFIDSTFVDTFRKTFPDRAKGMSKEAILAQRGTMVDGVPVEQPMLRAFTAENQQRLQDAGFQPTKGNTYLSHFLGSGDAIEVLSAKPDTPVADLLSPRVLKANPEVFAKAKTAGDLIRWAGGGAPEGELTPRSMRPLGTEKAQLQNFALDVLNDAGVGSGKDRIADLINGSTSGGLQKKAAEGVEYVTGVSTSGMKAISSLEAFANDKVLAKLGGKLGAQISDEDRKFIVKTMGDIANPEIAADRRLAAWGEVKRRLAKYADVDIPTERGVAGETPKFAERKRIRFGELGD